MKTNYDLDGLQNLHAQAGKLHSLLSSKYTDNGQFFSEDYRERLFMLSEKAYQGIMRRTELYRHIVRQHLNKLDVINHV